MTEKQIAQQIKAIQETTAWCLAGGPERCRQFLVDAGILKVKKKKAK